MEKFYDGFQKKEKIAFAREREKRKRIFKTGARLYYEALNK